MRWKVTKKVVINIKHGGFGLSQTGLEMLAKLKNQKELHHYRLNFESRNYEKVSAKESDSERVMFVSSFTEDFGPSFSEDDAGEFFDKHLYSNDTKRHDVDLVKVVESLGNKADGPFSKLKIVEIPKEVDYKIEEYDGWEWIAEVHQTWS